MFDFECRVIRSDKNQGMQKSTLQIIANGEPSLLVQCLYLMSPLNHKRTTSSLVPPIICVAKKLAIKR